ncbi:MAG: YchJ family metal-binding protein, partial [Moraxella sp.]|nr:YchJ family metal-binding protein [Moraxella sp.]
MMRQICPCSDNSADNPSGGVAYSYEQCCKPLHTGKQHAKTAEQLMRSRFCAFYFKNVDYIIAATVPSQQALLDKTALQAWADNMHWTRLEIISHNAKIGKRHGTV